MLHPPYGFEIFLVNVKTIRRMVQIFVAFSEKLNFTYVVLHIFVQCHFGLKTRVIIKQN